MQHYSILPQIYETVTDPGRWRRALDGLASVLDARAIALRIRRESPSGADLDMLSSAYLDFSRSPSGLWYGFRLSRLQDPDWDHLSRQPPHLPTPDTDLPSGPDALDARKDYAFLRKKVGVRRRMGVRLNSDRVWCDALSVAFHQSERGVPTEAQALVRPLLPHLTKAVEMGRVFYQLQRQYKAALGALDHVKVGLAFASADGQILVDNAYALDLYSARETVWKERDGRLVCNTPDKTAALAEAIAIAASTANGSSGLAEHLILVRRECSELPVLVDVKPAGDGDAELEPGLRGALITIIDTARLPKLDMTRFVALYGLTSAEADVCSRMMDGLTAAEIAEHRNTSPTTTKNQIAAILAKTNTRRRVDFIKLVLKVIPPIR